MRLSFVLLYLCLVCTSLYAQKQNNIWIFGKFSGISFNTTPPTKFTSKAIISENGAVLCDAGTGALMFYTDGNSVWDQTQNTMPNGYSMGQDNNGTSAQGAVIVPTSNKPGTYYLFTVGDKDHSGLWQYSEIDMSLNSGKGDVVATNKNNILGDGFTEAMTAVSLCDMIWVMAIKRGTNQVYAYCITPAGISGPVISTLGYPQRIATVAYMKISPNKGKLAIATHSTQSYVAIHDFDVITGAITNGTVIDSSGNECFYGCEFSPDNTKLYAAEIKKVELYQYDVTLPASQVAASRQLIYKGTSPGINVNVMGALQLGPDSNIYVALPNSKYLGRITDPNNTTPVYTHLAVNLGNDSSGYGLPQPSPQIGIPLDSMPGNKTAVFLCKDSSYLAKPRAATYYFWQDGNSQPERRLYNAGTYWVRTIKDCIVHVDTFDVKEVLMDVSLGVDTFICSEDTVSLKPNTQRSGTTYLWSTGSTAPDIKITEPGTYTVTANFEGCVAGAAINIRSVRIPTLVMGNSEELCGGQSKLLPYLGPEGDTVTFQWQDGSKGRNYTATKTGTYKVSITNRCNVTVTDSVKLFFRNCNLSFPSAFSPNGDGLNDIAHFLGDFSGITDYTLSIANRYAQKIFYTEDITAGWDGTYKGQPQPIGTYMFVITYQLNGKDEVMKGDVTLIR